MIEWMLQEAEAVARFEAEERSLEMFTYEWVYQTVDTSNFNERARLLNINVYGEKYLVLYRFAAPLSREWQRYVLKTHHELTEQVNVELFIRWGEATLLLLIKKEERAMHSSDRLRRQLAESSGKFVWAGVGEKAHDSVSLNEAWAEANTALEATIQAVPLQWYKEMALERILTDVTENTKHKLVKDVLAPIEGEPELLKTLRVYFDSDRKVVETSAQLDLHPNTIHDRLRRISEKHLLFLNILETLSHYTWPSCLKAIR